MAFRSPSDRANVALDIETEGFDHDACLTVVGLADQAHRATVVLNAAGRTADAEAIATAVADAAGEPVEVSVTPDEATLLETLQSILFDRVDRTGSRLVAFNGDTWRGGFDLPFLRTRCGHHDVDWPLDGYTFTDVYPLVDRRFNTTGDADGAGDTDLVTAHRRLCLPDREFDPFADSAAAVDAYRRGAFVPLVQHNVSDLHRTLDLAELACRYVPATYFDDYKL